MDDIAYFDIMPELLAEYADGFMDSDPELDMILSQIETDEICDIPVSTITQAEPVAEEVPANQSSTSRFHKVDDCRLTELFEARHSSNTKRNTSWGINIFNGM